MKAERPSVGGRRGGRLMTPGRITVAVLAVLGVIFLVENTRDVRVRLLIPEVITPLWLVLVAVAVIGAVCGVYAVRRRR